MKILFLSDLQGINYNDWEQFLKIDQRNFELIIVLGDIDQSFLYYISKIFNSKTIFGVLGNHDCHGDLEYSGITNIHNSIFIYKNISFVGLEGSIKYKEHGPMLTQYESEKICDALPKADILISHNSPKNIHDTFDNAHEGFYGILNYIHKNNPKWVVHGHQHKNKETLYQNTLVLGVYGGIILDIDTGSKEQVLSVE